MVGVHQQTGLQSGRSWCPGGESQSSRDEPDLSLWRRGPQNAQPTLASVCTVRIVCVARSCLSSTYLAAGTLPVRVNVVVLNTSVPNEAASFTGRSGHQMPHHSPRHEKSPAEVDGDHPAPDG